jgi:DNA-3-methyladenine glycosylase
MLDWDSVNDLFTTHPREFYARSTLLVARDLVGTLLCRRFDDGRILSARILEVEAYTEDDPACHAFRGKTKRCQVMFGAAGHVYVYFVYGMYWCLNVVTEPENVPGAVLIRAIEMEGGKGPGKLCRTLEIDRRHYGVDLCDSNSPIWLAKSPLLPEGHIETSPRVGLNVAQDRVWRFYLKNHKGVSPFKSGTKRFLARTKGRSVGAEGAEAQNARQTRVEARKK